MQPLATLGLKNAAEHQAYLDALEASHRPEFTYDLFDLNDKFVASIPAPEDGVVTGSNTDDVTRMLTGSLFDPDHTANLDTSSPAEGTLNLDRIIRVQHHLFVPELGRDVVATPFYGWLTKADRKGDFINLEGQGLQRRTMFGQPPRTVYAGAYVVNAIAYFLKVCYGETRLRFPSGHKAKIPKNVTIGWEDETAGLPVCKKLARSIGMILDVSCDGWWTLRPAPATASMRFTYPAPGASGRSNMTSEPELTTDALAIRNVARKIGKGNKVGGSAVATASHPLSPRQLARHGVPFYMPITEQNDAYATKAAATNAARAQLRDLLREVNDTTFTATPMFHLDLDDLTAVATPEYAQNTRLSGFTLPLDGNDMTINRKAWISTPNKRRIRA